MTLIMLMKIQILYKLIQYILIYYIKYIYNAISNFKIYK